MFHFAKKILISGFLFCIYTSLYAQESGSLIKGHFNGSFENYSQYYFRDSAIGASVPPDRVGANSFLKLDYNNGRFSAGVQMESYMPALLGFFPVFVEPQSKIVNKYFKYSGDKFSIQVGDFYEQFGSGMIFRAFENRQIGINNALEGVSIYAEPLKFMKVKAVYGRARRLFDYSKSLTRGLDADIDINSILHKPDSKLSASLGGSYVGKYQVYTGPADNFPNIANSYAGRFEINHPDFSLDAEYVTKSADPNLLNNYSLDKGRSLQINGSFNRNNFGVSASFRSLYNMNFVNDRNEEFISLAPVNFVPALTKQHDLLTSNIYVYAAQLRGETGFQADLYYHLTPGSKLGGKYGMQIAANFSRYAGLNAQNDILAPGKEKYFSDANIEIKKKWSRKWETTFMAQQIFYNSSVIRVASDANVVANVFAIGALYKWAPKKSVRIKVEHLATDTDDKNWASALAEFSFSSPYQFFISDLYNYGKTNNHYYNVGASVTKKATRFSLSFGKQRPGLFCVGGICRFVPAAYGFTASLTSSFAN